MKLAQGTSNLTAKARTCGFGTDAATKANAIVECVIPSLLFICSHHNPKVNTPKLVIELSVLFVVPRTNVRLNLRTMNCTGLRWISYGPEPSLHPLQLYGEMWGLSIMNTPRLFAIILRCVLPYVHPSTIKSLWKKRNRYVHAIVDGWTSPIAVAYLGLGVQWEQDAEIFFMVLEFIRCILHTSLQYSSE
jgi:hypothetical protein